MRKTSRFISLFEKMSHESVRTCYHRIKEVIKPPEKKPRKLIAVDETKIKLENKQIFVWSARMQRQENAYLYRHQKAEVALKLTFFLERF